MADKRSQASSPQAVSYLDGSHAPYPNDPPVPYPVGVPHLPYSTNDGQQWQAGAVQYPYANYNTNPHHNNSDDIGGGTGGGGERYMEDQFISSKFSDKNIRRAFIRKVYVTLSIQLSFTLAIVCIFVLVQPVRNWVRRNAWFYYLAYAIFFVTYLVLGCIVSVRRKFPGNYICLSVFTFALSYMAGAIGAFYGAEAALIAVVLTFALCICITLFAMQTRIDFTMCSGMLFVFGCVVMLTGIVCMIVFFAAGPNKVLQGVYGGLVTLLFGLYLAYDTQQIMGGRQFELEPEEYIFGAMQLYVDVVFMFMAIAGIANAAS
ncbi:unnamed protein product [Trichobilharzia szidati]|nr:unnamed protein product [Trichobilharzia szidati]CAH8847670.1 unnamed protein product [Trichobilharzia szidati]